MRDRFSLICVLLFLTSAAAPLLAADEWVKLTTPHFEMYTTAGEKKGREAILYFEQVRAFFQQTMPSAKSSAFPARLVAFKNEKQYQPYRPSEAAFAYYTHNEHRDYIVMQSITAENYPVAVHEYVHLLVGHSGAKLPYWLNEGLAEVYSTMKPAGKKVRVGDLPAGRVQQLLQGKWLDLRTLFAVDEHSPFYNEKAKAGMFYAESWAMVHMLNLAPDYSSQYQRFLLAILEGATPEKAFLQVYNKDLDQVQKDLHQYLFRNQLFAAVLDVRLQKSDEDPEVVDPPAFETDEVQAELLDLNHKPVEARAILERLAKEQPNNVDIQETLGYLEWHEGKRDAARERFARAYEAGSKNARMCWQYALLSREAGVSEKVVIAALRKAVELKPDFYEARYDLAVSAIRLKEFQEALAALQPVKKVTPEQAPRHFAALAFAALGVNDVAAARKNTELAKQWAKAPEDVAQVERLTQYLDQREAYEKARVVAPPPERAPGEEARPTLKRPAPETPDLDGPYKVSKNWNPFVERGEQINRVEGVARNVECRGQSARFHIDVNGKPMVFDIPDPTRVLMKNSAQTSVEFTCGTQRPVRVAVEYAPPKDGKSAGIVRALEFE